MSTSQNRLTKLVSGGQTGGDAGGLAAAVTLGLETGGWVPRGWRTETGPAPWLAQLGLKEHASRSYVPRTRQNVGDSDGTFWIGNQDSPGGRLTLWTARHLRRPLFLIDWDERLDEQKRAEFRVWLEGNTIEVLNVAGNRESGCRGITQATHDFIVKALQGD